MTNILKKPYTNIQRADFVHQNFNKKGLKIFETEDAIYALEKNQTVLDGLIVEDENYVDETTVLKNKILETKFLTASDVERALYKSLKMDFEDIITLLESLAETQGEEFDIDIKALKIELRANNFYRKNPYVDKIGKLLGYSEEEIDNLFLNGELPIKSEE